MKRRILGSPIQSYTTLELNNRTIFLYDRMDYHLPMWYTRRADHGVRGENDLISKSAEEKFKEIV